MPELDLSTQVIYTTRLIFAAVLGMVVGLERERHEHPAGMRTHLLVAVGAAAFTILSVEAFAGPDGDRGRVAAQIVAGIGFLGAGAILKEGATVRGLTTAASLWAIAAIGMAVGVGMWGVGVVVTVIVVVSLWPLRIIAERYVGREAHRVLFQLSTDEPQGLGRVVACTSDHGATIAHLATNHAPNGGLVIELEVKTASSADGATLTVAIAAIEGVDLVESRAIGE
jgi:putative Mg2+ transporter-C (MgtC) family protein